MSKLSGYKQLFESYRWRLCELKTLEAELDKVRKDIDEGIASRYSLDPDCEKKLTDEYEERKAVLKQIDGIIDSIPETKSLLPCKLYLRLHYISGYTLTETANELGVSLSTLSRIRRRCAEYFES